MLVSFILLPLLSSVLNRKIKKHKQKATYYIEDKARGGGESQRKSRMGEGKGERYS